MARAQLDIAKLYERLGEDLLLFFIRRTADPEIARDLWAETFAQALDSKRRFRGRTEEQATAWLYTIARRQLARYYRRGYAEQRAMHRLGIERPPDDPLLDTELAQRAALHELRHELAAAMALLSADTRHALELRIVEELPYTEIARRLAISETSVRARVSRGLRTLQHALDTDLLMEATQP